MSELNRERAAAATGLGFVAFVIIALLIAGDAPGANASADDVRSYFVDERTRVLVATFFHGLAVVGFLWFLGFVVAVIVAAGKQLLAAAALGAGVTALVLASTVHLLDAALAHTVAATADPGVTKAIHDVQWALATYSRFPLVALAAAVSLAAARTGIFPAWYAKAGFAAALLFAVGGAMFAEDGFFSPTGGYGAIVLAVFLLWVAVTSGLLLRRVELPTAEAEPATP